MTDYFTVGVRTRPEDVDSALDALRSADIPAWYIHLADKDLDLVEAGFPDDGGRGLPSAERLNELDSLVSNAITDSGIAAEILGHGRSLR